ncbi:MAG: hypothetical protein VKP62_15210 [Candidatus Sericytochromatia bacterium]|nr:hypothetical protein [Candidatus Sericytochromatia bacterium]
MSQPSLASRAWPGACLLSLTLIAWQATGEPAGAIAYGGWTGGVSLDTYYNDSRSGTLMPMAALPATSEDVGLNAGLNLGQVFVLTPEIDTWVIASVHGRAGALLPAASALWGSLYANTIWHLDAQRETYVLLGSTQFFSTGSYQAFEGGYVQSCWPGARARLQVGAGQFVSLASPSNGFTMPSLGGGIDQSLGPSTVLSARYAYQSLLYAQRVEPRQQGYVMLSHRLESGWEAHLQLMRSWLPDTGSEGYLATGLGYDF